MGGLRFRNHVSGLPQMHGVYGQADRERFLRYLQDAGGIATLNGTSIYESEYVENAYIILGSESLGIDPSLDEYITQKITIPSFNKGPDSLNVAVAAGIICYELRRHKK